MFIYVSEFSGNTFRVKDSCFGLSEYISFGGDLPGAVGPELAILHVYHKKKLNIINALIKYYVHLFKQPPFITGSIQYKLDSLRRWAKSIDAIRPTFRYGSLHYPIIAHRIRLELTDV